jgi:hypothetical protein
MHVTTVYESLPHVLMPPAAFFDRPVQVTWATIPISSLSVQATSPSPEKIELAGDILARIGQWEGEPLVREPQGELQERDELL